MINRELIRVKVVQLTYAYYQNGNHNIDQAEKELLFSLSKAYDLYNYMLWLIVAITREARRRMEITTQRAQREGTELPSQKFAYNKFAVQLEDNLQLNDFIETKKMTWDDDIEVVRKILAQIEESEIYQAYMDSEDDSYDTERHTAPSAAPRTSSATPTWMPYWKRRVSTGTTTRRWLTRLC